jgi:hypothetical protein
MEEREKKRFDVIGASLDLVNFHHPMVTKHGPYRPFVLPIHGSTRLLIISTFDMLINDYNYSLDILK